MNENILWNLIGTSDVSDGIKLLSKPGFDIEYIDPVSGWSFLHRAVEFEDYSTIDALVGNGLNIDFTANCGYPAIFQAVDLDIDGSLQQQEEVDFSMTKYILDLGADSSLLNNSGASILEHAESYGKLYKDKLIGILRLR